MKAKIKVTYKGFINSDLDEVIIKKIKSVGGKWYAQGFDHVSGERDISFDLDFAQYYNKTKK